MLFHIHKRSTVMHIERTVYRSVVGDVMVTRTL